MSQVVIDDIIPRTQLTSTAGQTVFNTNWTADVATDIDVYARASGDEPDDQTQLVNPSLYNVTFVGGSETVRVTFLLGRTIGDIITIVRNTPAERLNLYINTNFVPSMLNEDFGILTLVDQQAQMYDRIVNPGYNVSATIEPIVDEILPILQENQVWAMNSDRTKIIGYNVPAGGGMAPSDAKYLLQTSNPDLPNAQDMGSLSSGLVVNTNTTGVQLTRILTAVANQISLLNANGISGNPTIGISQNAKLPGVEGIGFPEGTTAQRPLIPIGTNFRFNTSLQFLEYWNGVYWNQIAETGNDTSPAQALYISNDGSDTTGSGTIEKPFATYEKARSIAAPLANASTPYVIIALGIFNIVGDMEISPFVNIFGYTSQTAKFVISGQLILSPTFDSILNAKSLLQSISIEALGDINLVFNNYQNGIVHFKFCNLASTPNLNVSGAGTNIDGELFILESCVSMTTNPDIQFTNILSVIIGSTVGANISSINNSAITNNVAVIENIPGLINQVTLQSTNTGTQIGIINNNLNIGFPFTIDGANQSVLLSSSAYNILPTFLGGASFSNITLISLADGINANANFTPVSYSPIVSPSYKSNSVTANLAGIDAALTGITGGGRLLSFQTFISGVGATYTKPTGVTSILVEVIGGGGGGGGATGAASSIGLGGGGGAAGYASLFIPVADPSYLYTVGAGGAGGAAGNNPGVGGGTTTFGGSLQASGGLGGAGATAINIVTGAASAPGGAGGVGANGDINANGESGGAGNMIVVGAGGLDTSGMGGSSFLGGGAPPVVVSAGSNAVTPGSGGSGASTLGASFAGGDGKDGLIRVWEFS